MHIVPHTTDISTNHLMLVLLTELIEQVLVLNRVLMSTHGCKVLGPIGPKIIDVKQVSIVVHGIVLRLYRLHLWRLVLPVHVVIR